MAGLEEKFDALSFHGFKFAEKKHGEEGKPHKVTANFTDIRIKKGVVVYEYHLDIQIPDYVPKDGDKNSVRTAAPRAGASGRKLKQQRQIIRGSDFNIFRAFYDQHKNTVFRLEDGSSMTEPVSDGKKVFYTLYPITLNGANGDRGTYEVRVEIPEKKYPQRFIIHVIKPRDVHRLDLGSLMVKRDLRSAEKELQALDLIISYGAKHHNLVLNQKMFVRKNDLTPQQQANIRFPLGELKEGSFGYHQSARLTEAGLQLNVDRTATVFYKGGKLKNRIEEYLTEKRNRQRGGGNHQGGGDARGAYNRGGSARGAFNRGGGARGTYNRGGSARGGYNRGGGNQHGGRNGGDYGGQPQEKVVINDHFEFARDELRFLKEELKGLAFQPDHTDFRPKNVIQCLTDLPVKELRFTEKPRDGGEPREWSVKEYFDTKYSARLGQGLNGNLPAVQVDNNGRPAYYPLEVVNILEDQCCTKTLTTKPQAKMTQTCGQQKPVVRFQENKKQIQNLIVSSRRCKTDFLNAYGISLAENFVRVDARLLDPPKLIGPGNQTKKVENGAWRDTNFIIPALLPKDFKWMVVNITSMSGQKVFGAPNENEVDGLVANLFGAATRNGLNLPKPKPGMDIWYKENYGDLNDLRDAFTAYIEDNPKLGLIVFLIPANDELYNNIKFISELEFGIVTQCVAHAKAMKFDERTYGQNLMLKINSKLGGINTYLSRDCRVGHLALREKTMIMGLDVTHPSKHDRMGESIVSVVATYDSKMVNYHTKCVVQPNPRLEIVDLRSITREMLNNFKSKCKDKNGEHFYPEHILVYRDGVSENQFQEVAEKEILDMKKAFEDISKETGTRYDPKVTFIVVQKRHYTRFLPEDPSFRNANGNPLPGMVVDNTIVSNFYNEFYLSAHYGALGTTRPARYTVLYDDSGFTADDLQKTTYFLSHLFPRCSKVVSLPAPVLYAHLCAKRARSYLLVLNEARGQMFGDHELNPNERANINQRIAVHPNLQDILYFV